MILVIFNKRYDCDDRAKSVIFLSRALSSHFVEYGYMTAKGKRKQTSSKLVNNASLYLAKRNSDDSTRTMDNTKKNELNRKDNNSAHTSGR